ncbi:MAG: hypothetical protein WD035_01440 [Balneolaceae bacterium]
MTRQPVAELDLDAETGNRKVILDVSTYLFNKINRPARDWNL